MRYTTVCSMKSRIFRYHILVTIRGQNRREIRSKAPKQWRHTTLLSRPKAEYISLVVKAKDQSMVHTWSENIANIPGLSSFFGVEHRMDGWGRTEARNRNRQIQCRKDHTTNAFPTQLHVTLCCLLLKTIEIRLEMIILQCGERSTFFWRNNTEKDEKIQWRTC